MANKRSEGKGSTGTSMGGSVVYAVEEYRKRAKRKKQKQKRLTRERAALLEAATTEYDKRRLQPWPIVRKKRRVNPS